eukprot:357274-Chlamydomonas_euryale.AAC.28
MAPKRKAVKATAAAAAKARKLGLSVGDDFPDLGPIETEQSTEENQKTVDLKARECWCRLYSLLGVGSRQVSPHMPDSDHIWLPAPARLAPPRTQRVLSPRRIY